MQATIENVVLALGGGEEMTDEQVKAVISRVERRIPNFSQVQAWLEANPYPEHDTWEMYCISGFSMPPRYSVAPPPKFVNAVLGKIFMWIVITDVCGPNGPFQLNKVREAFGR